METRAQRPTLLPERSDRKMQKPLIVRAEARRPLRQDYAQHASGESASVGRKVARPGESFLNNEVPTSFGQLLHAKTLRRMSQSRPRLP